MTPRTSPSPQAVVTRGPGVLAARRLAEALGRLTPRDGLFELGLRGVYAIRASWPTEQLAHVTQGPALCLVAQGAKMVMLGREVYEYDASRMLAFSVDLPVAGQVVRASPREPYLAFKLDLDPARVAELALKVYPRGVSKLQKNRGLAVVQVTDGIVEAATRLVELTARPDEVALLGPLVIDEIVIRLLRSSIGGRVAEICSTGSRTHTIARAIGWLRANFSQPVSIEALAGFVHMSPSSFHQNFKAVTSMSPLQYQKLLRLQEARRLMLSSRLDAATACQRVGYLSASQFSREYARFFGSAPKRDIGRLRRESIVTDQG